MPAGGYFSSLINPPDPYVLPGKIPKKSFVPVFLLAPKEVQRGIWYWHANFSPLRNGSHLGPLVAEIIWWHPDIEKDCIHRYRVLPEDTIEAHYQAAVKTEKDPDGGPYPAYPSGKSWDEPSGKTGSGKKFYHNYIPGCVKLRDGKRASLWAINQSSVQKIMQLENNSQPPGKAKTIKKEKQTCKTNQKHRESKRKQGEGWGEVSLDHAVFICCRAKGFLFS